MRFSDVRPVRFFARLVLLFLCATGIALAQAPQLDVAPIDSKAASMPTGSTLDKGLKGLK